MDEKPKKLGFQGLSGKEVAIQSRSVITTKHIKYGPRTESQKLHGATFPVELAEYFIRLYTKKGDYVIDPFAGVGSTLIACKNLQRFGLGIELYQEFVDLTNQELDAGDLVEPVQLIVQGDSLKVLEEYEDPDFDLVFTSPPYGNSIRLIKNKKRDERKWKSFIRPYGDDENDLG